MKNYIFRTTTTMKEYNNRKWWIDRDIVTDKYITAENVTAALEQYRTEVENKHYITISNNALKNKSPMYIDTVDGDVKQVGFVITGKTEFEDRDKRKWSTQYIDLWVNIITVVDTEF